MLAIPVKNLFKSIFFTFFRVIHLLENSAAKLREIWRNSLLICFTGPRFCFACLPDNYMASHICITGVYTLKDVPEIRCKAFPHDCEKELSGVNSLPQQRNGHRLQSTAIPILTFQLRNAPVSPIPFCWPVCRRAPAACWRCRTGRCRATGQDAGRRADS